MRRLRDYHFAVLTVAGKLERNCHVIAVEGDAAILQPHAMTQGLGLHEAYHATLRFHSDRGHTVLLCGQVMEGPFEETLTFVQGDRVWIPPRRSSSRLPLTAPVVCSFVPSAMVTEPQRRPSRTVDMSAKAIRLEFLPAARRTHVDLELTLPGREEPLVVSGRAGDRNVVHLDENDASDELARYILRCRQQIAQRAVERYLLTQETLSGKAMPRVAA